MNTTIDEIKSEPTLTTDSTNTGEPTENSAAANEAFEKLKAEFEQFKQNREKEYDHYDEMVRLSEESLQESHRLVLEKVIQARDQAIQEYNNMKLEHLATVTAGRFGLIPAAIPDLISRARENFIFQDGTLTAIDPATGGAAENQLGIEDWVACLLTEAPHLFAPNKGCGSSGSALADYNFVNPFAKETWNLTKQGELYKKDRGLYERLKQSSTRK